MVVLRGPLRGALGAAGRRAPRRLHRRRDGAHRRAGGVARAAERQATLAVLGAVAVSAGRRPRLRRPVRLGARALRGLLRPRCGRCTPSASPPTSSRRSSRRCASRSSWSPRRRHPAPPRPLPPGGASPRPGRLTRSHSHARRPPRRRRPRRPAGAVPAPPAAAPPSRARSPSRRRWRAPPRRVAGEAVRRPGHPPRREAHAWTRRSGRSPTPRAGAWSPTPAGPATGCSSSRCGTFPSRTRSWPSWRARRSPPRGAATPSPWPAAARAAETPVLAGFGAPSGKKVTASFSDTPVDKALRKIAEAAEWSIVLPPGLRGAVNANFRATPGRGGPEGGPLSSRAWPPPGTGRWSP